MDQGTEMRKRIEREIIQVRKDFELARECHAEMYEYIEGSQIAAVDEWEDILTNDFYDIEENVKYLKSFSEPVHANRTSLSREQTLSMNNNNDNDAGGSSSELSNEAPGDTPNVDTLAGDIEQVSESVASSSLESSEPAKSQNIECLHVTS